MTEPIPTAPPTRPPASTARTVVEGTAILSPLAVVLGYFLPADMPQPVRDACVALVVALGSVAFHLWRDRVYARTVAVSLVAVVLFAGCVHFDGPKYRTLASNEAAILNATAPDEPLAVARCEALREGARALRDSEGTSTSVRLPLFAGSGVGDLAEVHDHQAALCTELQRRDAERGVAPDLRQRNRKAWASTWNNGRALIGGGGN